MQVDQQVKGTNQCAFHVEKRKRQCKLQVAKGLQYCGEHAFQHNLPTSKPRIQCPLDPKHSVFVHKLKKHLKICNSRPKDKPIYFEQNINIDQCEENYTGKKELASFTPQEVENIIKKAKAVQQGQLLEFQESVLHHEVLKAELDSAINGLSARKHLDQISSILGNMKEAKLFAPNTFYIEYGAGKGRLSQWIFEAVSDTPDTHFILVDRKNVRHKRDLHHKEVRKNLSMERLLIDIQDLALNRVPAIKDNPDRPIVAYCKHLCGAATDLALRSLFPHRLDRREDDQKTPTDSPSVKGVAMATCCHHCCTWNSYVGKDFLAVHGFSRIEFEALIRMSSWCVCGTRSEHGEEKMETKSDSQNGEAEKETLTSALGLTIQQREEIGHMCKRVLDAGRLEFLRKNGLTGNQVQYVKPSVTLENIMILANRREENSDTLPNA
ncbi:tRNA:m(4)X modification enzyme TRM13 homolog [Apostichopus japonicus]|uniref:tRNA:m(4)X modification enzyme TRM13 homolog n=1 Tax=Stichopus japonicus TaxID=307972 RepID=UPI003AB7DEC9